LVKNEDTPQLLDLTGSSRTMQEKEDAKHQKTELQGPRDPRLLFSGPFRRKPGRPHVGLQRMLSWPSKSKPQHITQGFTDSSSSGRGPLPVLFLRD